MLRVWSDAMFPALHTVILARRIAGDRRTPKLGELRRNGGALGTYAAYGDYDYVLHRSFAGRSPALQSARESHADVLGMVLDTRLLIGIEDGSDTTNPAGINAAGLAEELFLSVTLLRINDGVVRSNGCDPSSIVRDYVLSVVNAHVSKPRCKVLRLTGYQDILLLQWGSEYSVLHDSVRLLRHTTMQHVASWADKSKRSAAIAAKPNHLFADTYTIFAARCDDDGLPIEPPATMHEGGPFGGAPTAVPSPIILMGYHPGHEGRVDGPSLGGPAGQFLEREVVGVFDRIVYQQPSNVNVSETSAVASAMTSLREFLAAEQARVRKGRHDIYRTNVIWGLAPKRGIEVVRSLAPDSDIANVFGAADLDGELPPHVHLVEYETRLVPIEGFHSAKARVSSEKQRRLRHALDQLERLLNTYNLVVSSGLLSSAVNDLGAFLQPLVRTLSESLEAHDDHDDVTVKQPSADMLTKLVTDLSLCLEHRLNFTAVTFKNDLAYYDSSALHKVLRGFVGIVERVLCAITPDLKLQVHPLIYVGSVPVIETDRLYDTRQERFIVLRIASVNLFHPEDIFQVLHEISHHLLFRELDLNAWFNAWQDSVAAYAAERLFEGVPSADPPLVRFAEAKTSFTVAVREVLGAAVSNLRTKLGEDAPLSDFVKRLHRYLATMPFAQAFFMAVAERIDALSNEGGETELAKLLRVDPFLQEHLFTAVQVAMGACNSLFTEALSDFFAGAIVDPPVYWDYMRKTLQAEDVRLRLFPMAFGLTNDQAETYERPLLTFLKHLGQRLGPKLERARGDIQWPAEDNDIGWLDTTIRHGNWIGDDKEQGSPLSGARQ